MKLFIEILTPVSVETRGKLRDTISDNGNSVSSATTCWPRTVWAHIQPIYMSVICSQISASFPAHRPTPTYPMILYVPCNPRKKSSFSIFLHAVFFTFKFLPSPLSHLTYHFCFNCFHPISILKVVIFLLQTLGALCTYPSWPLSDALLLSI